MRRIRRLPVRFSRYVLRQSTTLRQEDIVAALRQFGAFQSNVLFVHSSLSACGHISGGAPTVIGALRDWIGDATLAMPAHSYSYPDGSAGCVEYDHERTPSLAGRITECFRRSKGVVRSFHPSHSLCCQGPLAEEICAGHDEAESPCGRGTPYARLVEHDAAVLLFGTLRYTLFHTAEDEAGAPYLYLPEKCRFNVHGKASGSRSLIFKRHDMRFTRNLERLLPWLRAQGLLLTMPLGTSEIHYIPHSSKLHQALVDRVRTDPFFMVAENSRELFQQISEGATSQSRA